MRPPSASSGVRAVLGSAPRGSASHDCIAPTDTPSEPRPRSSSCSWSGTPPDGSASACQRSARRRTLGWASSPSTTRRATVRATLLDPGARRTTGRRLRRESGPGRLVKAALEHPRAPRGRLPLGLARRHRPRPGRRDASRRGGDRHAGRERGGRRPQGRRLGRARGSCETSAGPPTASAIPTHRCRTARSIRGSSIGSSRSCSCPTCAMLISREAWQRIGLFDERLRRSHDDLDFCWRARLAGFRVLMTPLARARHRDASGRGERPGDASVDGARITRSGRRSSRC